MRSTRASAAALKTVREPSTFSLWVASAADRTANARWITTSAPLTSERTLRASVTSPWRYSVLVQPRSAGSNGRRAMPTTLPTRRERSSAETIATPRSPVGPVTATVSASAGMPRFYRIGSDGGRDRSLLGQDDGLAADEEGDRVG